MKSRKGFVKHILLFFVMVLFALQSFASIISGDDGRAFVTKGEFDSMKNLLQKQIDDYNVSLDNKIEGIITEYLSGLNASNYVVRDPIFYKLVGEDGYVYSTTADGLPYHAGYPDFDIIYYVYGSEYNGGDGTKMSKMLWNWEATTDSDNLYSRNCISINDKGTTEERFIWEYYGTDIKELVSGRSLALHSGYSFPDGSEADYGRDSFEFSSKYLPLYLDLSEVDITTNPFILDWESWRSNVCDLSETTSSNWGIDRKYTPAVSNHGFGNMDVTDFTKKYTGVMISDYDETSSGYFWDADSNHEKIVSGSDFSNDTLEKLYDNAYPGVVASSSEPEPLEEDLLANYSYRTNNYDPDGNPINAQGVTKAYLPYLADSLDGGVESDGMDISFGPGVKDQQLLYNYEDPYAEVNKSYNFITDIVPSEYESTNNNPPIILSVSMDEYATYGTDSWFIDPGNPDGNVRNAAITYQVIMLPNSNLDEGRRNDLYDKFVNNGEWGWKGEFLEKIKRFIEGYNDQKRKEEEGMMLPDWQKLGYASIVDYLAYRDVKPFWKTKMHDPMTMDDIMIDTYRNCEFSGIPEEYLNNPDWDFVFIEPGNASNPFDYIYIKVSGYLDESDQTGSAVNLIREVSKDGTIVDPSADPPSGVPPFGLHMEKSGIKYDLISVPNYMLKNDTGMWDMYSNWCENQAMMMVDKALDDLVGEYSMMYNDYNKWLENGDNSLVDYWYDVDNPDSYDKENEGMLAYLERRYFREKWLDDTDGQWHYDYYDKRLGGIPESLGLPVEWLQPDSDMNPFDYFNIKLSGVFTDPTDPGNPFDFVLERKMKKDVTDSEYILDFNMDFDIAYKEGVTNADKTECIRRLDTMCKSKTGMIKQAVKEFYNGGGTITSYSELQDFIKTALEDQIKEYAYSIEYTMNGIKDNVELGSYSETIINDGVTKKLSLPIVVSVSWDWSTSDDATKDNETSKFENLISTLGSDLSPYYDGTTDDASFDTAMNAYISGFGLDTDSVINIEVLVEGAKEDGTPISRTYSYNIEEKEYYPFTFKLSWQWTDKANDMENADEYKESVKEYIKAAILNKYDYVGKICKGEVPVDQYAGLIKESLMLSDKYDDDIKKSIENLMFIQIVSNEDYVGAPVDEAIAVAINNPTGPINMRNYTLHIFFGRDYGDGYYIQYYDPTPEDMRDDLKEKNGRAVEIIKEYYENYKYELRSQIEVYLNDPTNDTKQWMFDSVRNIMYYIDWSQWQTETEGAFEYPGDTLYKAYISFDTKSYTEEGNIEITNEKVFYDYWGGGGSFDTGDTDVAGMVKIYNSMNGYYMHELTKSYDWDTIATAFENNGQDYMDTYAPTTAYYEPYAVLSDDGIPVEEKDFRIKWKDIYQKDYVSYSDGEEFFSGYTMIEGMPFISAKPRKEYHWTPRFINESGEEVFGTEVGIRLHSGKFLSEDGNIDYVVNDDGSITFSVDKAMTVFVKWNPGLRLDATVGDSIMVTDV